MRENKTKKPSNLLQLLGSIYCLVIQFLSANFRPDIDLYKKYATISTSESKNITKFKSLHIKRTVDSINQRFFSNLFSLNLWCSVYRVRCRFVNNTHLVLLKNLLIVMQNNANSFKYVSIMTKV